MSFQKKKQKETDKKYAKKEKEHCVDKFPRPNTVKNTAGIFSSCKVKQVMQTIHCFFLFVVVFSNV